MAESVLDTTSSPSVIRPPSDRPSRGSSRGRPSRGSRGRSQPDRNNRPPVQNESAGRSRTPKKPPGLSTPPESVAGTESQTMTTVEKESVDDVEGELCFICGNSMIGRYYSLAPCNNAFCHVCSLRLRALYKSTNCPFCKTEHETVIFAERNDKQFTEFEEGDFQFRDAKLGILFETEQIMEDSMVLLRFNCPDPSCDVACRNWSALRGHVKTAHHRYLCSLCTQHKKVFTHEHILYTSRELSTHFATGDPIKDISLTGFTGHPKCKFCNQSFYSLDEFTQHSREKHERCHVCDRINARRGLPDAQPRYFIDYPELWKHFQEEHYPCGALECLEQKFVVFESEIDLKAHVMEVHMGKASKAELRDMRRVEVNFQYGTSGAGNRRGRRDESEQTGGREVDISTLPRDEQAYFRIQQAQREMASRQIGNVTIPPVRPREQFPPLSPTLPGPSVERPGPVRPPVDSFPPLSGARSPIIRPATPVSNLPPEVAARHSTVLEKAKKLLNNDTEKLSQFKAQVSAFRRSESTATELIDGLWDTFNAKLDDFAKLITSTADLFDYDAKPKRTELLGAWNDWKIQMQEANSAASSGFLPPESGQRSRILALKSSAKGRPSAGTQSVWNRIEAVAASRPVPSASTSSSSSMTNRIGALSLTSSNRSAPTWVASPTPGSSMSRPAAVRPTQAPIRNTSLEEFPSLPTSKPARERVVLNAAANPARPVMSWGIDSRPSENGSQETSVIASDTPKGKGKGKKKGKQVLFHVG